eukprot:1386044-Amorphochlora_amoeboformis.AAC.1
MVLISVLNNCLKNITHAEKVICGLSSCGDVGSINRDSTLCQAGKRQVLIRPSSKVIVKFLQVMQKHNIVPLEVLQLVPNM